MDQLFNKPFIAYDGSETCDKLVQVFKTMNSAFQKSNFVYVWDPCKNYIPKAAKGPAIEEKIKLQTEGLKEITIKLIQIEHEGEKSVNRCLLQQFFMAKSSFLMLGFFGSKGQKPRHADLSSRVSRFIYDSKATIALIKHAPKNTNSALFCFDGSEISIDGLNKAVDFCNKFNLSITIFHAFNQDTKQYSKRVKTWTKAFQTTQKSLKIESIIQKTEVVPYLCQKQLQYDWIILNKNGYRGEISNKVYVGETATNILTSVNCNLLILA